MSLMTDIGDLYGPGSNIGTRESSVQVNNQKANEVWYVETVLSQNRDTTLYPTPSHYVVPLSKRYKQVLEVELLTAQFPISSYNIEAGESFNYESSKVDQLKGNNTFRFNEGYIIDNGSVYGLCNDRLRIKEYNDFGMNSALCEQVCQTSEVYFPLTLSPISKIEILYEPSTTTTSTTTNNTNTTSNRNDGSHSFHSFTSSSSFTGSSFTGSSLSSVSNTSNNSRDVVKITTVNNHNITEKYVPEFYIVDAVCTNPHMESMRRKVNVNGKYLLKKIVNNRTILAVPAPCEGPSLCELSGLNGQNGQNAFEIETSQSRYSEKQDKKNQGWLYIPRVSSPHKLAEMVQDYLNVCSTPLVKNSYSVTFDEKLGKFAFTRSYGVYLFDLLAGSDDRSILSPTMGYSQSDYFYGQYSHLNQKQTILPSEILSKEIRPDILSETVGESAMVSIPRGNYLSEPLANAITTEMQRPIIIPCKNDLLVVQLMGQVIEIIVPPGMYDPQNLIEAIALFMNDAYYSLLLDDREMTAEETHRCDIFKGNYCLSTGAFTLETTNTEPFGLLFYSSTISSLLGFDNIDLTGNCCYISMHSVFFPVSNRRFTDQIYKVNSQLGTSTFRFIKAGSFQAPIVKVEPLDRDNNYCGIKVYTWTEECGGAAHGFQCGDIFSIEGQKSGGIQTSPPFIGTHVVEKVLDAYSFQLALHYLENDCDCEAAQGDTQKLKASNKKTKKKTELTYVATHKFQPFSLFFTGVSNSIGSTLGFTQSLSGCIDYTSPNQWNLARRRDVYVNISQLCDTDNSRICKTLDSGKNSKYAWTRESSFVRVPLSTSNQEGIEFGLLSSSSYYRKKRFTLNSTDFYEVTVSLVDECGELINFHGQNHIFDLRILIEQ